MLLAHGYSTYMVGKYHLLPSEFSGTLHSVTVDLSGEPDQRWRGRDAG
jgi:arylsulfatase A-like enzyme